MAALLGVAIAFAQNPKREFRGAWLHVIGQSQWQNKTTAQAQQYIIDQLDRLHDAGCNAVIFQVRPTADALYESELEPWSAWLTGKRGKAPVPPWDPLRFATEEAHKRGMEMHAWLNPYRVTSSSKEVLPVTHPARTEPHRFVKFNGQTFFDPAYPENRDAICDVVRDIVSRYDVDAIHIDDYFYPYPANGQRFSDDNASYAKFGNGMPRAEWRRHNVDMLIEQMHSTIKSTKPWVRFGVSPFGIWRNKSSDPRGSESSGLQNYDDLYADVLLWAKNGWVDYLVPQLYWELDTKAAPVRKLIKWWNDNAQGVDVYAGFDVKRTMDAPDPKASQPDELDTKIRMSRKLPDIKGNVWWHGYWVTDNYKGVAKRLASDYQSTLALPPAYGDLSVQPAPPAGVRLTEEDGVRYLEWDAARPAKKQRAEDTVMYAVYEFFPGEGVDISDAETLIAVTPYTRVRIPDDTDGLHFAVTALDRQNRESHPVVIP